MIGRSDHFADIVCPFDEQGCSRPYCHFWHSKDDAAWNSAPYTASVSLVPAASTFMGYVGYLGNEASQTANGFLPYQSANGYVGSIASTSSAAPSDTTYKGLVETTTPVVKERLRRRIPSPVESLTKPKLPVELPVDDILDPTREKLKDDKKTEEGAPQKKRNEAA